MREAGRELRDAYPREPSTAHRASRDLRLWGLNLVEDCERLLG